MGLGVPLRIKLHPVEHLFIFTSKMSSCARHIPPNPPFNLISFPSCLATSIKTTENKELSHFKYFETTFHSDLNNKKHDFGGQIANEDIILSPTHKLSK
jgi:hypothetical protein